LIERGQEMPIQDLTDIELASLFVDTGIDLSTLPAVATAREVAPVMGTTEATLAQDRYRRRGIPYVKFGARVRYLRADVARYLAANRSDNLPRAAQK
jgi:hypothetical protein